MSVHYIALDLRNSLIQSLIRGWHGSCISYQHGTRKQKRRLKT
jgi:hypothetical protein